MSHTRPNVDKSIFLEVLIQKINQQLACNNIVHAVKGLKHILAGINLDENGLISKKKSKDTYYHAELKVTDRDAIQGMLKKLRENDKKEVAIEGHRLSFTYYFKRNDMQSALAELNKIHKLDPCDWDAYLKHAQVLQQLPDRYSESKKILEKICFVEDDVKPSEAQRKEALLMLEVMAMAEVVKIKTLLFPNRAATARERSTEITLTDKPTHVHVRHKK